MLDPSRRKSYAEAWPPSHRDGNDAIQPATVGRVKTMQRCALPHQPATLLSGDYSDQTTIEVHQEPGQTLLQTVENLRAPIRLAQY